MKITWLGQSCFQIITSQNKNNLARIIIDPFDESTGLRLPGSLEAEVLLVTHQHYDHNNVKGVSGKPFLIEGPGEYEVRDVFVRGIPSFHDAAQGKERGDNTIYVIEAEDIKICHLGDLGQKELTEEQLEGIGEIDILMTPIGGNFTISAKEAAKVMSQIEPKITIPMHYALPKLKIKLESLDKFLKIFGIKSLNALGQLSIKKKEVPTEEVKIIVLKP